MLTEFALRTKLLNKVAANIEWFYTGWNIRVIHVCTCITTIKHNIPCSYTGIYVHGFFIVAVGHFGITIW